MDETQKLQYSDSNECFPFCVECITGSCAACKLCEGDFSAACAHCYTVSTKGQACLDKAGQRCEICWKK